MKEFYKWKVSAWRHQVLWVPLLLMALLWVTWPTLLPAAESVKLHPLDNLSENFAKVTYVDDDDWAATDCHILIGGLYGSNTITSGDVGPIQVDASGNIITSSGAAMATDLAAIEVLLGTMDTDTSRIGITQRASATTMHNAVQLDDSPTTATSSALDMSSYDKFMLYMTVVSTLTPTDVTIQVQFSDDGSTYYNYMNGPFGDLRYEDTATTGSGINECISGDVAGKYMKVVITGTATDGTNYFVVTVKVEPYN